MTLTLNPKIRRRERKIIIPAHETRTRTRHIPRKATPQRRESLQLCSEQRDRAVAIFNKLQDIEQFANRAPILRSVVGGAVELDYPKYRFWRVLGDPSLPKFKRADVQQLREAVIRYTILLYGKHIPYSPDMTTLEVVSKRSNDSMARPIYRPFINTFDFTIDPNNQSLPWAALKEAKIQEVKAQFAVLEMLAELSNPSKAQKLALDLEPGIVVGVLRQHGPLAKWNLAIRYVTAYSAELGQFVIDLTGQYLRTLPWRTSLPMSSTRAGCLDHYETVSHILRLMDSFGQHGGSEPDSALSREDMILSDRVTLLVMRAALLVHCYAKKVTVMASHGLLEASKKDTVDSYTTSEQFTSVMQARRAAEQGFDELAEKGYHLDEEIMYFVRGVY
ncbi:hypothetical protein MAJ_06929, partial [Metarhizium majus ARSEF 297]